MLPQFYWVLIGQFYCVLIVSFTVLNWSVLLWVLILGLAYLSKAQGSSWSLLFYVITLFLLHLLLNIILAILLELNRAGLARVRSGDLGLKIRQTDLLLAAYQRGLLELKH